MASKTREKIQGAILAPVLENLKAGQSVTLGAHPTLTVSYADREEGRATSRWDFVRDAKSPWENTHGERFELCGPKFHAESAWSLSDAIRIALNLLND